MKKALITGITGQDGSHLAEFLLDKGYEVHGMRGVERGPWSVGRGAWGVGRGARDEGGEGRGEGSVASCPSPPPRSTPHAPRPTLHAPRSTHLHAGDLLDQASMTRLLEKIEPDEIYNLASLSFVPASWQEPVLTAEYTAVAVTRILEAMRQVCPQARFYQASSSEMFGSPRTTPQNEDTPFNPRTPYGVAKLYAHHITVNYREKYGLYAASGILFNHEGPRRGLEFVTRKVTHTVCRIKLGLATELRLGNLQARRDWGYAGDYVRAMWLMLQQEAADDFVIGTGQTHTVRELVEIAFDRVGLDWRPYVVVDESFYRPAESMLLKADNSKARRLLGWQPEISFPELITMMVDADMELLEGRRVLQASA